jgi:hypothetical protein
MPSVLSIAGPAGSDWADNYGKMARQQTEAADHQGSLSCSSPQAPMSNGDAGKARSLHAGFLTSSKTGWSS